MERPPTVFFASSIRFSLVCWRPRCPRARLHSRRPAWSPDCTRPRQGHCLPVGAPPGPDPLAVDEQLFVAPRGTCRRRRSRSKALDCGATPRASRRWWSCRSRSLRRTLLMYGFGVAPGPPSRGRWGAERRSPGRTFRGRRGSAPPASTPKRNFFLASSLRRSRRSRSTSWRGPARSAARRHARRRRRGNPKARSGCYAG